MWTFRDSFKEINEAALEHSDIVTFHTYQDKEGTLDKCLLMLERAGTRPVICTEYMARHARSTFADILPIFKENNIGAINWGLVSGKTQTIYPWDSYQNEDRLKMPFHDVFEKDGSLLVKEEEQVFAKYTKNN